MAWLLPGGSVARSATPGSRTIRPGTSGSARRKPHEPPATAEENPCRRSPPATLAAAYIHGLFFRTSLTCVPPLTHDQHFLRSSHLFHFYPVSLSLAALFRLTHDSPARAKQANLHGIGVQSQDLGNLFHSEPFYFFQDQHGAVSLVQSSHQI